MPAAQYWFIGTAIAAGLALLVAILTLGFTWYRAAVTESEQAIAKQDATAQKEKTQRIKVLLGKASESGLIGEKIRAGGRLTAA